MKPQKVRAKTPPSDDPYVAAALLAGRPERICGCRECVCPLHAYAGACIWCRNGQHAAERRLKLKEKVMPDGAPIV